MIIHRFYLAAQLRSLFITQHNRQTEQLTFTNKQKQENVQGLVWTSSALQKCYNKTNVFVGQHLKH